MIYLLGRGNNRSNDDCTSFSFFLSFAQQRNNSKSGKIGDSVCPFAVSFLSSSDVCVHAVQADGDNDEDDDDGGDDDVHVYSYNQ